MLLRLGIGTRQEEAVVGVVALRGPDLLAIDHPFVTVELGGGLDRRQVGTGVGLRETLAPAGAALQDARQKLLLLLLGTPLEQRRADQRVAEEVTAHRGFRVGELF